MFGLLKNVLNAMASVKPVPVNSQAGYEDYGNVEIQLQDDLGNWRTFNVTRNIPTMVIAGMRQLSYQNPGKRIRAVTTNGQIVDIL
jgi:hypothetical protein